MKRIPIILSLIFLSLVTQGQESFYEKYFRQIGESENIGKRTLKEHLNDPKIPAYFKKTFLGDGNNLNDDDTSLAIIDSLSSKDSIRHPFYFVLVTRTLWWADGAFAEPLGISILEFVSNRTDQFFKYFDTENVLTEYDLNNWADQISMEIGIAHEGEERSYIEKLRQELLDNNPNRQEEIEEFIEKIKKYSP